MPAQKKAVKRGKKLNQSKKLERTQPLTDYFLQIKGVGK